MTLSIAQMAELNDKTVHKPGNGMDLERKSCGPIWDTIPSCA